MDVTIETELERCAAHGHAYNRDHPCPLCNPVLMQDRDEFSTLDKKKRKRKNFCLHCEKDIPIPQMFCDKCKTKSNAHRQIPVSQL